MDLIELLSRHQIALIDMTCASSAEARGWAQECADYYAARIDDLHDRLGMSMPPVSSEKMKSMIHA